MVGCVWLVNRSNQGFKVMTATRAGWGDPMERDVALIREDVKNDYITEEQANAIINSLSVRRREAV